MFRFIFLSFVIIGTSCFRSRGVVEKISQHEIDSIRRLDSLNYLITPSRIQKNDKFYNGLLDTTIHELRLEVYQQADVIKISSKFNCNSVQCDSVAKKYYLTEVKFFKDGKSLKTYNSSELYYSEYYSGIDYLDSKSLIFESPVSSFSALKEKSLPVWHLTSDTSKAFNLELQFKVVLIDSATYRKNDVLKIIKQLKPIVQFTKKIQLKNYHYTIKEIVLDSVFLLDKVFDAGLFGKADLYYDLFTANNTIRSNTDEQCSNSRTSIETRKLFLKEPSGEIIMHFMDEDVIYHDFLEGIHFAYGERDSQYVFRFDTSYYTTNIERIYLTIKNPELKKPGFKKNR
ncbi:MAG: hypothetical protein IM600_12675 [Bacteroidetes bacterium]|nr:hypothetical protein [Bacteroidota bacterium]MCA6444277.1 hypothetical protein [Bacteroidota bacterium]